ncbi:uncharacterized protein [Ptychodera flava]|uniref:uncharacterized protein n=1 Tax=Ptychodera flava TaxID=63121 RepID=UPI00396A858D
MTLQQYDYEIIYRPGKKHMNADGLSRRPYQQCEGYKSDVTDLENAPEFKYRPKEQFPLVDKAINTEPVQPLDINTLITEPSTDPDFDNSLTSGYGTLVSESKQDSKGSQSQIAITDSDPHVNSANDRLDLEVEVQVKAQQRSDSYLVNLFNYLERDELPADDKLARKVTNMAPNYDVVDGVLYHYWKLTGKATTKIDCNARAETVARILFDEVIANYGSPRVLLSDQGSNFLSQVVRETCPYFNIKCKHSSPYRPETNGLTEKFDEVLVNMLSMFVDSRHKDWNHYLSSVLFAYRVSPQESTGLSPFFMLYGWEATLPMDVELQPVDWRTRNIDTHLKSLADKWSVAYKLAKENIAKYQQDMMAILRGLRNLR